MQTLASFGKLNAAEQKLLNACVSGEEAVISETRPVEAIETGKNANVVRASFIRWLALGGDAQNPLHARGVQLVGAWIDSELDFEGTQIKAGLGLVRCHIAESPNMRDMQLSASLNLQGSYLSSGLVADRAQIVGSVFLRSDARNRFKSRGQVRLLGAKIGGNLECEGAHFNPRIQQHSLNAQSTQVSGNVFLRGDENYRFESTDSICLTAARVKGVLQILPSDYHQGSEESAKPISLDLSHCVAGFIQSDVSVWGENTVLDGFVYGSLRSADWQTKDYLAWLNKQTLEDYGTKEKPQKFKPQPWQQLISVLRHMGHEATANELAIVFEQRRYAIGLVSGWPKRCLHRLFGLLAGYGYRPLKLVASMLVVWLVSAMLYWCAAYHGIFTPSDALVFQNIDYALNCRAINSDGKYDISVIKNDDKEGKTLNWYTCGDLMGEYTTFSPLAYSLDVILPLVDLGQEKTWGVFIDTPKPNAFAEFFQPSWNHAARLLVWFEILFGWIASLVLVAVLTGLTDSAKPK